MNAAKRARINRENARQSTGPVTEDGKRKSSLNGFKHGLTGQRMILQDHEVEPYRRMSAALHSDYRPKTEIESQLVQKIADCNMRLNRIAAIDSNLLNTGIAENTNEAPCDATESVIAQTRSWVKQADSFEKLGRYEARISRQMVQYIRELDRIQARRKSTTETTESKKDSSKFGSLRKTPPANWIPHTMTAVAVGSRSEVAPGQPFLVDSAAPQTASLDPTGPKGVSGPL
jgi:hypothetical protein